MGTIIENFAETWPSGTQPAEESSSWTSAMACQRPLRRMAGSQCRWDDLQRSLGGEKCSGWSSSL